jgi:CubicO group peptidase (beta-lactamase class C family)
MKFKSFHSYLFVTLPILTLFLTLTSFGFSCHWAQIDSLQDMKAASSSTVLLNNTGSVIPLLNLENNRIASVNMGSAYAEVFDSIANKYTTVDAYASKSYTLGAVTHPLISKLKAYKTVFILVNDEAVNDNKTRLFLQDLQKSKQLIIVFFGNAINLGRLDSIHAPVIWSLHNSISAASFTAQLIFGGVSSTAKLTTTSSAHYKFGDGYQTAVTRLSYTVPEELGIKNSDLEKPIEDIILPAIAQHVTPGAVVIVVKDGKVIFDKAYGSHTYDKTTATRIDDIFDLASVTKIAATTMATMRLYEQNKINLDSTMSYYLPISRGTNKERIQVKDLMLHQAGLIPFIPFQNYIKPGEHSIDSSIFFPLKVADNYYIRPNFYQDVMLPKMFSSAIRPKGRYVYSDLSMYFMKEIIETQTAVHMDQYVSDQFYQPLGMKYTGFNPRKRFDKINIVPTENDNYFRHTLIDGYVHDQGAALAGGVAGHAGLFSTTNDLAILFQMILNGGTYGGTSYFKPATIQMFTSKYSDVSRRGLGFDRWDPDPANRYPSELASPQTYGHTGFTGTCVWVDPKSKLIFIFLSNRVYDQGANKLSSLRVRARIMDVIYKAINKAVL